MQPPKAVSSQNTELNTRQACCVWLRARYWVKTGMKAVQNELMAPAVPNTLAMTIICTMPATRLTMVMATMSTAAEARPWPLGAPSSGALSVVASSM